MAFSIAESIWDEGQYPYALFIQVPPSLPCHGFELAGFEQLPSQSALHPQPDPYDYRIKSQPPMTGEVAPVTLFNIDAPANIPPPAVLGSLPLTELEFFRTRIRLTTRQIQAAQLAEASDNLLDVSRWLVDNLTPIGLHHDDQLAHSDQLKIWHDFNITWLAFSLTYFDFASRGVTAVPFEAERLDSIGKELINICDRLEPYGLVDYEIGVWEEEILLWLKRCLKLALFQNAAPEHTHASPL